MGLFDFFKKKNKKEIKKEENLIGFLLFDSVTIEWEKVIKNLKEDWNISVGKEDIEGGNLIFNLDGMNVMCGFMELPIPNNEAEENAKRNIFWKDGVEITRNHKSHIILNIMNGDSAIEKSILFVKVASSFLKLENAIGIYKYPTVMPADQFVENAEEIKDGNIPLINLIYFGVYRNNEEISGYTYGLNFFGKDEIEVIKSKEDYINVFEFLYKISNYVVSSDVTLKHGETIGFSAEQKLKITKSKGVAVDGESIKIEY